MRRPSTKWLLILWAVACILGMSLINLGKLSEFDPKLKLSTAISDLEFEAKLKSLLQKQYKTTSYTTFHFYDDNCFCQFVAAEHILALTQELEVIGFNNIQIDLHAYPELNQYIPSTPALAIFGSGGELIYLGPYAQGLGCISGTGLVDKVIHNLNTKQQENTLIITETKGCYCSNKAKKQPQLLHTKV